MVDFLQTIDWPVFMRTLLSLMAISLVLGLLLMGWIFWRLKRIDLPPDADFVTALRLTPFIVVLMIDLLDFGLDFLSAPISWLVLGKLGLNPLRGVTVVEGIIPGTQAIPLMTVSWIFVRLFKGRLSPLLSD